MRKTWKEYKQASREREKERRAAQERELNLTVFQKPFSQFSSENGLSGFGIHYLILGQSWWDFSEDKGIEPLDEQELDDEDRAAAFNSLGKAELVLGVLEDVIETLAADIANYKRSEIEARIGEIQKSDLRGPGALPALEKLEHLKRMRHNLTKSVRRSLPQTRAAGS